MKYFLFLTSFLFITTTFAQMDTIKTALIIVDIQNFYFPGGKMELVEPEEASLNAKKVLGVFRDKELPIIHVRHNFEPGGEIHENVKPIEGEKIISKDYPNSFRDTELLEYLQELKIEQLVIIGMQTHMCLEATTRAAADFGFKCIVVEDACTTRDLEYDGRIVKAEDVHSSTLSTLNGSYAKIMKIGEFVIKFN
jgi:nicotinamidase-related amidase